MRKGMRISFGVLLIVLALLSLSDIGAHFIVPGVPGPAFGYGPNQWCVHGFKLDCSTWWGTLALLLIDLCLIAWGWRIVRKNRESGIPRTGSRDGVPAAHDR